MRDIGQSPASEDEAAITLHRQRSRHCHTGQRERPELLHCEAAAAPARQRLAIRPGDAHALAGSNRQHRTDVGTAGERHCVRRARLIGPAQSPRIVGRVKVPVQLLSFERNEREERDSWEGTVRDSKHLSLVWRGDGSRDRAAANGQAAAALHCDGSRYRAAADADAGLARHKDRASRDRAAPTRRALS